jgi:hypothetical protein
MTSNSKRTRLQPGRNHIWMQQRAAEDRELKLLLCGKGKLLECWADSYHFKLGGSCQLLVQMNLDFVPTGITAEDQNHHQSSHGDLGGLKHVVVFY